MNSLDPGIEPVTRPESVFDEKALSKGSGEGTLAKSSISLVLCLFGGIPVGVSGGDKEAGDVASPWNPSEKCTRLSDRRLAQNATRRMASNKANGFGCRVALVQFSAISKRLAILGHNLLRSRAWCS